MSSFKLIVWSGSSFTNKTCPVSHLSPGQAHIVLQAAEGQRFGSPGMHTVLLHLHVAFRVSTTHQHIHTRSPRLQYRRHLRWNPEGTHTWKQWTVRSPSSSRTASGAAALIFRHHLSYWRDSRILKFCAKQLAYSKKPNLYIQTHTSAGLPTLHANVFLFPADDSWGVSMTAAETDKYSRASD